MELSQRDLRGRVTVEEHGCWVYNGPRDANGYGRVFLAGGKERKAPRVYYETFIGPIPGRGRLQHHLAPDKCIGSVCCNPAHLQVRTPVTVPVAQKVCKRGHLMGGANVVVEQRGPKLVLRCRTCRQEDWRKQKRLCGERNTRRV